MELFIGLFATIFWVVYLSRHCRDVEYEFNLNVKKRVNSNFNEIKEEIKEEIEESPDEELDEELEEEFEEEIIEEDIEESPEEEDNSSSDSSFSEEIDDDDNSSDEDEPGTKRVFKEETIKEEIKNDSIKKEKDENRIELDEEIDILNQFKFLEESTLDECKKVMIERGYECNVSCINKQKIERTTPYNPKRINVSIIKNDNSEIIDEIINIE